MKKLSVTCECEETPMAKVRSSVKALEDALKGLDEVPFGKFFKFNVEEEPVDVDYVPGQDDGEEPVEVVEE